MQIDMHRTQDEPLRQELAIPAEDLHQQDQTAYDAAEEVRPRKRQRTQNVVTPPERITRSKRRTYLSPALIAAITEIANDEEPLTYKEAVEGLEGQQWL